MVRDQVRINIGCKNLFFEVLRISMFFVTGNYLKSNLSQDKTQNRSSDSNNAVDGSSTPSSQKPVKGVRFKESFLTIPRPPSEAFGDEIYDNNTSASYSSNNDNDRNDKT